MADAPRNHLYWLNTIQRYLDRELTPQELKSFNASLQESASRRRLFIDYAKQSSALLDVLGVHSFSSMQSYDRASTRDAGKSHITPRQFVSLSGYLLGQVLISKPAYKVYAIAATLLLAVTLFLVFADGEDKTADPLAGQGTALDAQPETPDVSAPTVVATLTAERDARWDRRPGQDLYAGQRFTLTAGFAEITTRRGAIAILEAPATIELLNNDNAIRLHTGKLVGICETDSSKGFLVRTSHMDVTDLGTRFGVDASNPKRTSVHVFKGEVEVSRKASSAEPTSRQRITTGQSLTSAKSAAGFTPAPIEPTAFAAMHGDGALNTSVLISQQAIQLDLVDLLAGGDGRGDRSQLGLNQLKGTFELGSPELDWRKAKADGRFHPVLGSPFVAGVFAPLADGSVTDLPDRIELPEIPANGGQTFGLIWCGGKYPPSSRDAAFNAVIDGQDYAVGGRRALYLHPNNAVVIDIKAIEAAYPGMRCTRFKAIVSETKPGGVNSGKAGKSFFMLGCDASVPFAHTFERMPGKPNQVAEVDVAIPAAGHLSLISTDGGDGSGFDRLVLGNPQLILEPIDD